MAKLPILLTVLSLSLLSLPAAAMAESAGGDQYVDPLAGLNGGDGSGSNGGTSSGGGSGTASSESGASNTSGASSSSDASAPKGGSKKTNLSSSKPSSAATLESAAPATSATPAVKSGALSRPVIGWEFIVVLCLALAGGGFALWRRSHGRS